jgi:hypothetical protein
VRHAHEFIPVREGLQTVHERSIVSDGRGYNVNNLLGMAIRFETGEEEAVGKTHKGRSEIGRSS